MLPHDAQRLEHIRDYCVEIEKTIARYGNSFEIFDKDADYQRSVSFCILQSVNWEASFRRNTEPRLQTEFSGGQ